jgi:hypothetical protein
MRTHVQLVGGAQHGGETERPREAFRAIQVRLLERQPRQVAHFDDRVRRAPGMLPAKGTALAVQVFVDVNACCHDFSRID